MLPERSSFPHPLGKKSRGLLQDFVEQGITKSSNAIALVSPAVEVDFICKIN
jgi:hypothetical protein